MPNDKTTEIDALEAMYRRFGVAYTRNPADGDPKAATEELWVDNTKGGGVTTFGHAHVVHFFDAAGNLVGVGGWDS